MTWGGKRERASSHGAWRGSHLLSRLALTGAALALIGTTMALLGTLEAERRAREQTVRTAQILTQLRLSLRAGVDAETGQRGYLLTGDSAYLLPFEEGRQTWLAANTQLRTLFGDAIPASQQSRLNRLDQLTGAKLAELEETIRLTRTKRRDEAVDRVTSGVGRELMTAFRAEVRALEATEEAMLFDRLVAAEKAETQARQTVLVLFGLMILLVAAAFVLDGRAARAEAAARDAAEIAAAKNRAELLARELNHRVKNLFAVVLSIVGLTARQETDAAVLASKIRTRIEALAAAHAVSQGSAGQHVDLDALVKAVLKPYDEDGRISCEGPQVDIPSSYTMPLGLILHELATNAVKYGALSNEKGRVYVHWVRRSANEIDLGWREAGGPPVTPPSDDGFGTRMTQQSAKQLGGTLTTEWRETGLKVALTLRVLRSA